MKESTYSIAPQGYATSFSDSTMPVEYALEYKNRFQNADGSAEKRQGIVQLGSAVPDTPEITNMIELIKKDGTIVLFATGHNHLDPGTIYTYNEDTEVWSQVYQFTNTGFIGAVQFKNKMIFYNGVDVNVWTEDGVVFKEMKALHEIGTATATAASPASAATSAAGLSDNTVANWVDGTNVTENDLLYNVTLGAYAVITAVTSGHVTHTTMGTAATGIGIPGTEASAAVSAGVSGRNQAAGDMYQLIDLLELNIIPTDDPENPDNTTSDTISPTNETTIAVSGVADWTKTDLRVGDYIRNTTRAAVTQVTSISTASFGVHGVSGQTANDTLVFLKSAMPLTDFAHVHYNRVYYIDSRDKKKVRISGAGDAQDLTRDAASVSTQDFPINVGTIDRQSFDYGGLQPAGDELLGMVSWQRFIAFIGKRNVYIYEGTTPVGTSPDFAPVAFYPQGCVSKFGFANLGNELVFISPNGVEGIGFAKDASSLSNETRSSQINTTLRNTIANADKSDIRVFLYQKRSWMCFKIGSQMFIHNFAPVVIPGKLEEQVLGSWHLFDGKFAQMSSFYVRTDGTLLAGGANGVVAKFDQNTYNDLGDPIQTSYKTGFLAFANKSPSVNIKHGKYIKPLFEVGQNTNYTISVEAPYNGESSETIIVSTSGGAFPVGVAIVGSSPVGGSSVINQKYPLIWRGERASFQFKNNTTIGPDIISEFTVYFNDMGKQ